MVEAGIVLEELGAVVNPGPWPSTAVAAVRALIRTEAGGDEAAKLLAGIADGSAVVTVGPLDPAAERPVANGGAGGTAISGVADLADAAAADVILVLATDGGRLGLYAVDADGGGIAAVSRGGIDPTRKRFRCTFTDAPARRLATVTPQAAQALLGDVLVAMAADAVGAARSALELAVEHAKVRNQFGHPIGSFQAVQHMCADMFETVELARSGVLYGLWTADAADPAERHLAAVRAKAFAGRLASVGDTAVQVAGGLGFTWEHDLHLYLKRLLSWSAYLGAPDRYLLELGSRLVLSVT
jgi:alkylation response protein AidB-like acyl-CoA dehydrogenase